MTRDKIIDALHGPSQNGTLVERAVDEIDRIRAENLALRAALHPCGAWLRYAYGHVSSVTADKVKAHLPKIDAIFVGGMED